MRIINKIYSHDLDANNQKAAFIVDLSKAYWENWRNRAEISSNDYYDINRAMGDVLDKYVQTLYAEEIVSFETRKNIGEEHIKKIIVHKLAHSLAEEIIKSDYFHIRHFEGGYEDKYAVSIPLLRYIDKEK